MTAIEPVPRTHLWLRAFWWLLAPVDSRKQGLSITRLMSVVILWMTFHLAHDWIDKATKDGVPLGFAFTSMVVAGFTLAVCTALGGKYVAAFVQSKFAETSK